jgi:Secretion system C-terminal sorting domain
MKQLVLFFVLCFSFLFNEVQAQSQIKWQLKDSVIKFPSNFGSWIERNVGKYNPYNEPLGTRVPSFQLKETGDFNKDGFTDLCMELNLRFFDTNNPSNPNKYQDSLMNYYKGIFINQKNGTFLLDTNYIIKGRGAIWDGGFGDFNGDGLTDYYNNCIYYEFDQKNKDILFYKYGRGDASPSHVFFNNGKSFDRVDLDTVDMITTNSDIIDINKDGKDEIIVTAASKFIVYQYDLEAKKFIKKFNNVNDFINKKYGTTIKFFNFKEKIDNSILVTLSHGYTQSKEDWMIDILQINLIDSSIKIKNSFKHPSYKLNDGSLSMAGIADKKGNFKYEDLNKDGIDELIWLGYFSFNNPLPSIFQSNERMGINIIENNIVNTPKYWNYDTTEIGFRIGGYITDLNADKRSEIISEEWLDNYNKYFAYYYSFDSGMYNKKFIEPINKNVVIKKSFQKKFITWAEDFDKNGTADIIIYDPDNLTNNYIYKSIDCKDVFSKPIFNTSKFVFCSNDSLKLSITNVNKGDTLKWFYGSNSDISNTSSKIFSETTKLFVTRTDSIGCVSVSDTIEIKKFNIPSTPTISRDTSNSLISNASIGNVWYKDGTAISDTAQKFKPSAVGSYTVKTTQNGCVSALSNPYYFLVTDIINLSATEFIKLTPNPFVNQLNFDFVVKGYQRLNLEIFDIATGTKVASKQNQTQGMPIYLGHLSAGTYVIKVSSTDNKISYQFKMVKL